jgi:2-methylcitrate dehydratase PrpD
MKNLQTWLVEALDDPFTPTEAMRDEAVGTVRDLAGVATIGSTADATARVRRYAQLTAGPGGARCIGTGEHVDPVSSALVNGTAAQAFDFDDIAPACVSHVSALMVPALLAVSEIVDPRRALDGYVRGLTIINRLAEAFTHEVYDRGIQPTHTMGSIGAVSALIWALDESEDTADAAFSMLATQMIGLRSHTGTRYKAVQAGNVASAAVRSVLMARQGLVGGGDAIDVVVKLMGITDDEIRHLVRSEPLHPVALAPKWFPTCGAAHTAIEATLALRDQVATRDNGLRLRVSSAPRAMNALAFDRPTTPDQARFSMPYCVTTAWLTGGLAPSDFSPEAVNRRFVVDWLDHVEVVLDDSLTPPPTWSGFPAIVEAIDSGGAVVGRATADKPLGYPERPLSDEQLRSKFIGCVTPVLGSERAVEAWSALQDHDVLSRVSQVLVEPPLT